MRTAFEREGDLRSVDILAAFVTLWREKGTGVLRAFRPAGACGFEIAEGEVVGVSSSDPRFETSAILVRAGKIEAATLERLSAPEGSDQALAALQAGILTRREWRWGEKIRAIEVLSDLLAWPQGEYEFDSSARPEAGERRVSIPRLLLELFLRSRDQNLIEHQLGPPDAPLVRSENFEEEFSNFGLTADAESVVRLIDGRATAAEISRRAPADEFAVQKLLASLVTLKLVRPEYAAEERPAPPAAARKEGAGAQTDLRTQTVDRTREEGLFKPGAEQPEPETVIPEVPIVEVPGPAAPPNRFPPVLAEHEVSAGEGRRLREAEPSEPLPSELEDYEVSRADAFPDLPQEESEEIPAPESESAMGPLDPPPSEPSYQTLGSSREPPAGSRRSGAFLGWLLVLLVVGVAGFFLLRPRFARRPESAPVATRAVSTPVTEALSAPTALAASAAATPAPTAGLPRPTSVAGPAGVAQVTGAPRAGARQPRGAQRPSPVAQRTSIPQPPAVPPPAIGAVAGETRDVWIARAERYRKRLASEPTTRFAIQLELACEVRTLQEAWRYDRPAGTLWLLPASHAGRPCLRVLWGRYPNLEAARKAKPGIPRFFVTATNRPAVVAVR